MDSFDAANLPAPRRVITNEEERQAFALMAERGAPFCQALANLWMVADELNRARIRTTYAKEIAKYVDDLKYIAPEARP